MKRIVFALALGALSTTAAMAAAGDAWYGTNRDTVIVGPTVTYVEPAPAPSDSVTVYYDQPAANTAPVIVERGYALAPAYDYMVVAPGYYDNESHFFQVEPRKYGSVYNGGIFPRRGPNDFGQ